MLAENMSQTEKREPPGADIIILNQQQQVLLVLRATGFNTERS
jgi:hypothetical protein